MNLYRAALCAVSTVIAVTALGASPLTLPFQLTHSRNMDPAVSPDGKQRVYIGVIAGKEQLFTMNADASAPTQITRDDADHEDPSWSPDGARIAFVHLTADAERIYVMSVDGKGATPVSPAAARAIHPGWSADSKSIIYCTDDDLRPPRKNDSDINVVDLATGKVQTLITGGVNTYPDWSPDMKQLAFRRIHDGTNSEIFIANADGSNPRNLTNDPAFDGWPAWSPDGQRIAFASNRNARYQIFVMKSDGTDVRLVANTEGRATAPRWSPDGRTIYFTNCVAKDYSSDCEVLVAKLPDR